MYLTIPLPAEVTLTRNVNYCLAIRATGAGNVSPRIITISDTNYRKLFPGSTTLNKATRDGGSGNFSLESPALTIYEMAVRISSLSG